MINTFLTTCNDLKLWSGFSKSLSDPTKVEKLKKNLCNRFFQCFTFHRLIYWSYPSTRKVPTKIFLRLAVHDHNVANLRSKVTCRCQFVKWLYQDGTCFKPELVLPSNCIFFPSYGFFFGVLIRRLICMLASNNGRRYLLWNI